MEKIIENIKPNILSEISRDIAQVLFAAVFIEPIISGETDLIVFILGFLLSLGFWIISIKINKL